MVDINTYRRIIGCFNPRGKRPKNTVFDQGADDIHFHFKRGLSLSSGSVQPMNQVVFCIRGNGSNVDLGLFSFYIYYILIVFLLSSNVLLDKKVGLFSLDGLPSMVFEFMNTSVVPFLAASHIKLAYFVFIYFILMKTVCGHRPKFKFDRTLPSKIFFGKQTSRSRQFIGFSLAYILLLNFLLIGIVNTSLLNPGPQNLKIYYQNVQGLIPFSNLKNDHPALDRTKICELNSYIQINRPDVVILNETWLKRSIGDCEIIENTMYKVFRKDRTILSHPIDPVNPNRFRRSGGGVLIAIRSDLNADSKRISMRNGAEIVAIEVDFGGTKFIFCTCYRVGTLGPENHESFSNSIRSFYKSKKPKKVYYI